MSDELFDFLTSPSRDLIYRRAEMEAAMFKLDCVITMKELADIYGLSSSGAQYWLSNYDIAAVQASGGQWLVWLPSVVKHIGRPPYPEKAGRQVAYIDLLHEIDCVG